MSYRFSFTAGKPTAGFTTVAPTATYNPAQGYGYEPGTLPTRGKPVLFSVAVPEGNYNVTVTCGDASAASETVVKAEAHRWMLPAIKTRSGEAVSRTFTVNVRRPEIAGGGRVRLKGREVGPPLHPNWDDKLTLEFNGANPAVQKVEIIPAPTAITVYLLGDSTVTDQVGEPWSAWGQMLPRFFQAGVAVSNQAESGEALRSSLGAHRLDKVLSTMKPGDYLFIQYGHNDQKEKGEGVGAFTTYKADLKHFVEEAKKKGGIPVLVTSMHRRRFDADGKIIPTLGDYPEAVRQVAKEENVALIDLNAMSKILFEAMGQRGTLKAFVHYPANTFPGQSTELKDDTHFNTYGAYELARCIVEGIRSAKLPLAQHLTSDAGSFDPAHPDPVAAWDLPLSPVSTAQKPEGN